MKRALLLLYATFSLAASPLSPAAAQEITTTAHLQLRHFLEHHNPEHLKYAEDAAERLADDPVAQTALREAFRANWMASGSAQWPLEQFAALARRCPPFGQDRQLLVDMLVDSSAPGAWADAAFRRFVAQQLPATSQGRPTTDRLLEPALPGSADAILDRYAFLLEVVPEGDANEVRRHFRSGAFEPASPAEMPAYVDGLRELADKGLERFSAGDEAGKIRRVLGDQLYERPAGAWAETGDALETLVRSSSKGATPFLDKSADYLRSAGSRSNRDAGVLQTLSGLVAPAEAYKTLGAGKDLAWFEWLHEAEVVPQIHTAEAQRGGNAALRASFDDLREFVRQGNFRTLFGLLDHYYERLPDDTFNELIRPRATGPDADLVLGQARTTTYKPRHREMLARAALSGSDPLAPAWEATNAPGRLAFAIDIYNNLVKPDSDSAVSLNEHLSRPLLDDIAGGLVGLFKRDPPPVDTLLSLLDPLADHLEACRAAGADSSTSRPLLRLEREIAVDIAQAITDLPQDPQGNTAMESAHRQALRVFVQKLALALRVRTLVARALGRTPDWMGPARIALRDRVFGIGDADARATLYWEESLVRFRAQLLVELDGPLRKSLTEFKADSDAELFFREIYLPLVRVHGFLKVLRLEAGARWPHLAWVQQQEQHRSQRLAQLFRALQSSRWVDADDAVLDLLNEDLAVNHPGSAGWTTEPGELCTGAWSVNCNLRVWKRLLSSAPPNPGAAWKLRAVATKIVAELEGGVIPSAPTFPTMPGQVAPQDGNEDRWSYFEWAENIVTAAEWHDSPFLSQEGAALPWEERLKFTANPELPFHFELKRNERSRLVDGRARRQLADLYLDQGSVDQPARLARVARVALFLPNHADNLAAAGGGLAAYAHSRQQIYARLAAGGLDDDKAFFDRFAWLMRLHVSQSRSGPPLEPRFDAVVACAQAWANGSPEREAAVANVLSEQVELESLLRNDAEGNVAAARLDIDRQLDALMPKGWTDTDQVLIAKLFRRTLAALDDERVRHLLWLRRRVEILVSGLTTQANVDTPTLTKDLTRLRRCLDLIDASVWYSRPDFDVRHYIELRAQGKQPWWPALVALAWYDVELQTKALQWVDRVAPVPALDAGAAGARLDGQAGAANDAAGQRDLADALRRRVFQLNEATFATVRAVATDSSAAEMLSFDHAIPWTLVDLRLLAEAYGEEHASARTLANNAFHGVLLNLDLAGTGRPPSDDELWQRFFGALDYFLPPHHRRRPGTKLDVNLDEAVHRASVWSDDAAPEALRLATRDFLEGCKGREHSLLQGAKTTQGPMRVFHEVLARSVAEDAPRRYQDFYTGALSVDGRFSEPFVNAVAAPFFGDDEAGQRSEIEILLQGWRDNALLEGDRSPLRTTYRQDFGRVIKSLVQGQSRPDGRPYIWAAVDALRAQKGILDQKPSGFLQTAAWLFKLRDINPQPELAMLFGTREGTP